MIKLHSREFLCYLFTVMFLSSFLLKFGATDIAGFAVTFFIFLLFVSSFVFCGTNEFFKMNVIDVLVFIYSIIVCGSFFWSEAGYLEFGYVVQYLLYSFLPYFVVRIFFFEIDNFLLACAASVVFVLFLMLFIFNSPVELFVNNRLGSEDLNPIALGYNAGILFLLISFSVLSDRQTSYIVTMLLSLFSVALLVVILLTGSRSCMLTLFLLLLPYLFRQYGFKSLFLCLFVFYVVWFILTFFSTDFLFYRFENIGESESVTERFDAYKLGVELISDNPVFGVGVAGFDRVFGLYPHNIIIENTVSFGFVGFLFSLSVVLFSIYLYIKNIWYNNNKEASLLSILLLFSVVVKLSSFNLANYKDMFIFIAIYNSIRVKSCKKVEIN